MASKKRISIIGTNGIPACYGGFETLVEYLTRELGMKYDFTVYCSSIYNKEDRVSIYNNSRLLYLPFKANGFQSLIYDIVSTFHAWFNSDVLLVLGPAGGMILPFNRLFRKKIIVNHGGLDEWKREKYSKFERKLISLNHKLAAVSATYNVADNKLLCKSLASCFQINAVEIAYGGDHITVREISKKILDKYTFLNSRYDLSVSRAQVDNKLHLLLETYVNFKSRNLVLVSNWNISEYGKNLKKKYLNKYSNIFIVEAIYDNEILDIMRSNTDLYIHSHSCCGTAPSLVEAMNYKIPVICFDVETNRETTNNKSLYFSNAIQLKEILDSLDESKLLTLKNEMFSIAQKKYKWSIIAKLYSTLFDN